MKYIVGGYDDSNDSFDHRYFNPDNAGGLAYTMMRWFAKNYSDGELADTIYAHSSQAYAGNLGDDTFIVASGTTRTTLNTAGGHDTLIASNGSEVFLYAAGDGNDTINNFNTSADRI